MFLSLDVDKKKDDEKKYGQKYTTELREEAKKNRVRYQTAEAKLKQIEDDELKAKGEHEKRANKIEDEAKSDKAKLIKSIKIGKLESEAEKQGIIDIIALGNIDLDSLEMDENYRALNVKEVIEKFKEEHPKLFDDNEDEDDDDRDPEDNKKSGKEGKNSRTDLDKMSPLEKLTLGFSPDGKGKKKKRK